MISGKARLAGVMGWPVAHSLSPRLHGYWLKRYGIDGAYVPLAVRPDDLLAALSVLPKLGFSGVNLTVPHKETAIAGLDRITSEARQLGAVNTVRVDEAGRLVGSNTDGFGFLENLRHAAPQWQPPSGPAVIIGAGGAARAVTAALISVGVPEIRLVNRTQARSEALACVFDGPIQVRAWADRHDALDGASILVNTTTLGMTGQPDLDLNLEALPPTAIVNDIVYAPLKTTLLLTARARGNPIVDGLGMLLHQARPGFEAWFGVAPQVTEELRDHLLEGLKGS
ncbi:MAG: shikimate dehydrogenase [Hyphomicrobiales bacterium]|nr:shikimate dehydrogenase [Hyphomicrobiales bacterium]